MAIASGQEFYIHAFHAGKLYLDCNTCHLPVSEGSVVLQRPGHAQCTTCHSSAFESRNNRKICAQCHSGTSDLLPFPRYKNERAILFEFSHARHVDPKARVNPKTGFRADCTFCHKFEPNGMFATFPGHTECSACHGDAGMKPMLSNCRGCHAPEEIENPRRTIAPHVASGKYADIKFTHAAHFRVKEQYNLNCTTCHYAIPQSTSLADLALPNMLDCVGCHDTSKALAPQFRMSNCRTCHIDRETGLAPASHARNVKPAFHTESFRRNHEAESNAPGAKCFVCHQNVTPSAQATNQCTACHLAMRPVSHTARWKDDIHGEFAALDRQSCAQCHTADSCIRCHNQLPRSHAPLPVFRAGAHARLAMLNQRACMTCHTFQNTCAECHTRGTKAGVGR